MLKFVLVNNLTMIIKIPVVLCQVVIFWICKKADMLSTDKDLLKKLSLALNKDLNNVKR